MYPRLINPAPHHSFFLFGPRGTGKTTWIKAKYPKALYLNLLETQLYTTLLAHPNLLESLIPPNFLDFIIIDEIQRVPELLNEVHRLIESPAHYKFILTGSSARKLRRQGINLLAGRAYLYHSYPLTAKELGKDFHLEKALKYGTLPAAYTAENPTDYLQSYLGTYLEQEIIQEGMTRQLSAFYRFLEIASFSQGSIVNTSAIAREVGVDRKVVENYFSILIDLLVGVMLLPFTRRAKRRLVTKPKFYFIDSGLYRAVRPQGYLDMEHELGGLALETIFLAELRALNEYQHQEYQLYYFRTASGQEIDFVAYGKHGFHAFEIKLGTVFSPTWTKALQGFGQDYPEAKRYLLYMGTQTHYYKNIVILPFTKALSSLSTILNSGLY